MGTRLGLGEILLRALPAREKGDVVSAALFWFRNDLRLADNAALRAATMAAQPLFPVYVHDPTQHMATRWGFPRTGIHRRRFLADTLEGLARRLRAIGSDLAQIEGRPRDALTALAHEVGAAVIYAEEIAAPEEQHEVAALRERGLDVRTTWQSSLLEPEDLPFAIPDLHDMFTVFRQRVEKAGVMPRAPLPAPESLGPLPKASSTEHVPPRPTPEALVDDRSSFPYFSEAFAGGETAATQHLDQYFARGLAHSYKATRNGLTGIDVSSKLSPWLASGALSARTAYAALKKFEAERGANDSTYWLWFELLWRDHFRFLHLKYGRRLYRARGLNEAAATPPHDTEAFARWREGQTGEPLIDAGMRELAATGYLSNRMRQIVASYLVNELACDWRAGAAWFESQLLDFDIHSNQGNWLYIAGRGTDPRGGRRFNPQKQATDHDPNGTYRTLWSRDEKS